MRRPRSCDIETAPSTIAVSEIAAAALTEGSASMHSESFRLSVLMSLLLWYPQWSAAKRSIQCDDERWMSAKVLCMPDTRRKGSASRLMSRPEMKVVEVLSKSPIAITLPIRISGVTFTK